MPKYEPTEDDMMDAYGGKTESAPVEKPAAESVDEENAGADVILIEKDKLPPGCKVGDEYTFRVSKDFGDEKALKLVEKDESETTEEPESVEAGELAALSEEGE